MPKLGQQLVDAIDGVDDVCVGLLGNDEKNRRIPVEPAGCPTIPDTRADGRDVRQADHGAIRGFHDQRIVFAGVAQLIVDADGYGPLVAVERAQWTGRVRVGNRRPHVLHGKSHGRQTRRVDTHAYCRLFRAGNRDIRDARHLGQTLRDYAVCGIVDGAGKHGLGREGQYLIGAAAKLALRKWQRRQIGGQVAERRVQRGLYVAGSTLNAAVQIELDR